MICGAAVVAGVVAGGLVAFVVEGVAGFAVVAGAVVADATVVVLAPLAPVVVVVDELVVEPASVEVFDVELQPTATALIKTAERNLRRGVMPTHYAMRELSGRTDSRRWSDR